jgi:hypothetical protein
MSSKVRLQDHHQVTSISKPIDQADAIYVVDVCAQPISGHKGRDRWICAILTRHDLLTPLELRVAVRLGIFFNCKNPVSVIPATQGWRKSFASPRVRRGGVLPDLLLAASSVVMKALADATIRSRIFLCSCRLHGGPTMCPPYGGPTACPPSRRKNRISPGDKNRG